MNYATEAQRLSSIFQGLRGEQSLLTKQLTQGLTNAVSLQARLDNATKARTVIQYVAQKTQQNLEYHMSHIISLALASVWDDPYQFSIKFVQRRNKTECDLKLVRGTEEVEPLESAGGGVCDVVSFALQVAFILMKKARKVLIGDEPFSFLHSPTLQQNCSDMVKNLCDKTKMQIIMVSGQSDITTCADKSFKARLINGITEIKE